MSLAFRVLGPKTFQKGKEGKFGGEWDGQTLVTVFLIGAGPEALNISGFIWGLGIHLLP